MPRRSKDEKKQHLLPFLKKNNQKMEKMLEELEKDEEKLIPQTKLRSGIKEIKANIITECLEKKYETGEYQFGEFKLVFNREATSKKTIVKEKEVEETNKPSFHFERIIP